MLRSSNPFLAMKKPPPAQELLEDALVKAFKPRESKRGPIKIIARKREIARVRAMANSIARTLDASVRSFPSLNAIHPFYHDLADVSVGNNELKKALGGLNWARKLVHRLATQYSRRLERAEGFKEMEALRKAAMGRMSSAVKQVSSELEVVREACSKLGNLPDIGTEVPTVVVAGMPNTGKSTLVRRISSGKPKVASYPFTTTSLLIGHFDVRRGIVRVQVIDTPGLLDRPLSERNEIEMQGILALRHLAWVIVYLMDPTETTGHEFEDQKRLLDEISSSFREASTIVVLNRTDLRKGYLEAFKAAKKLLEDIEEPVLEISAKEGYNLSSLVDSIGKEIEKRIAGKGIAPRNRSAHSTFFEL